MTLVKDHHKFKSNKEILSYLNNMEVNLTQDKVLFWCKFLAGYKTSHSIFSDTKKSENRKIKKLSFRSIHY